MKVVITGASGFIGSQLLTDLQLQPEIEILATVNRSELTAPYDSKTTIISGGYSGLKTELLSDFNPDFIFHLARPTFPKLRIAGRWVAGIAGQYGNKALLRRIHQASPNSKLVYVSGSLMYGNSFPNKPHLETSELNPISYARQYHLTEAPILGRLKQQPNETILFRVPWVLGAGSWFHWIYRDHFRKHGTIPVFGAGQNLMQFILLKDLSKWIIETTFDFQIAGVKNLFSNATMTQRAFAETLAKMLNCKLEEDAEKKYESAIGEAFQSNIELRSDSRTDFSPSSDFDVALHSLVSDF